MKKNRKNLSITGVMLTFLFIMWTLLIQIVDVQTIGPKGMDVGFATINQWFHSVTGTNMQLYNITDWLGLVPVFICIVFGLVGFVQLIKRKSFLKVDFDILVLGVYYVIVIFGYLIFEMIPINYRPILINGFMEASYPSSTTLLVLSVMPTLVFQANLRFKNEITKKLISTFATIFCIFMVVGRTVSGVHWLTDIIGSILLSAGLFCFYKVVVLPKAQSK